MSVPANLVQAKAAFASLRAGRFVEARDGLLAVVQAGRPDASVWTALAMAQRGAGDDAAALAAVERGLALEPRSVRALLLKADLCAARDDARAAAAFYGAALRQAATAPPPGDLAPDLRRAEAARERYAAAYQAHLRAELRARGFDPERSGERFAWSLDLLAGVRRVYVQEPRFYYFPGLPQRPTYPREAFSWVETLEGETARIREELPAGTEAFTPYVQRRADRPGAGDRGMAGNAEWSAFHLMESGIETSGAALCPRTMTALAAVPLYRVPGRSPVVLFSRLTPGAHIPPHTGFVNTRLICHLPLVAPDGCSIRIGDLTHRWREGELLIFDDTFEHEAWNRSERDRVVLIFDIPRPELSPEEHALVGALFEAVDSFGTAPAWSA